MTLSPGKACSKCILRSLWRHGQPGKVEYGTRLLIHAVYSLLRLLHLRPLLCLVSQPPASTVNKYSREDNGTVMYHPTQFRWVRAISTKVHTHTSHTFTRSYQNQIPSSQREAIPTRDNNRRNDWTQAGRIRSHTKTIHIQVRKTVNTSFDYLNLIPLCRIGKRRTSKRLFETFGTSFSHHVFILFQAFISSHIVTWEVAYFVN